MKGWNISKVGIENLKLEDNLQIPELIDEYSIRIKVKATGLNPVDWKRCGWESETWTFPQVLGIDGCGVVDKIGSGVDATKFVEGKTVVYYHGSLFNKSGSFAEYYVHDSRFLSIVPQSYLDSADGEKVYADLASVPCAAFTAYQAVFTKLKLTLGSGPSLNKKVATSFIVTGGAGGVGGFCLQFLRLWRDSLNAEDRDQIKILTTCSARNFDYVKSLGATHPIDYNSENVVERVKELTEGFGVDAWIDLVGSESVADAIQAIAFGGEVVSVVGSPTHDLNKLFVLGQTVHHVFLGFAYNTKNYNIQREIGNIGDKVMEWIQGGQITFLPTEVVGLEEIKDSLLKNKEGHVRGKIVARVA
mmetsp:Transcript_24063/g.27252  ORF Transcript_24063/g.27252 Transcript_24063/m.27252 type:complete len:360 (+) Transcript_24063:100-1179(+)